VLTPAKWFVDNMRVGGRDLGPHSGTMVENCGRSNKFISMCVCAREEARAQRSKQSLRLTFYQVGELRVLVVLVVWASVTGLRPLGGRRLSPTRSQHKQ